MNDLPKRFQFLNVIYFGKLIISELIQWERKAQPNRVTKNDY